ncbi:MAG: ATP-dependent helicase [Candidatus Omnitrophica bacterium]|nr:ATP-dependent helicase [Candidatus Omnitrophota bacterium]
MESFFSFRMKRVMKTDPDKRPQDVNMSQWQSICYEGQNLLIVAGPGTGKTHTLIYRVQRKIQALSEHQKILAITFTHKAAQQMKERLASRHTNIDEFVFVGTFHSFCMDLLRKYTQDARLPEEFSIITEQQLKSYQSIFFPDEKAQEIRRKLREISHWKSTQLDQDNPEHVQAYNHVLRQWGFLDYDDILRETVLFLTDNEDIAVQISQQYPFIFVDEYQDMNPVQHALLKRIIKKGSQLTAIGDPQQAIYSFRGSDVKFFDQFEKDFPASRILSLHDHYRSAANLLQASQQVISARAACDVPKLVSQIYTKGQLIHHISPTDKAEAEYVVQQIESLMEGTSMFSHDSGRVDETIKPLVSFKDIAVFYRLNHQKKLIEQALFRSGMPYQTSGDCSPGEQMPVYDFITYLKFISGLGINTADLMSLVFLLKAVTKKDQSLTIKEIQASSPQTIYLAQMDAWLDIRRMFRNVEGVQFFWSELRRMETQSRGSNFQEVFDNVMKSQDWNVVLKGNRPWLERLEGLRRRLKKFLTMRSFCDDVLLQRAEDSDDYAVERIHLMTLHASKGLEFPVVFIVGCEDGILPYRREGATDMEEENRLFYVGMTRAQQVLYLTQARKRYWYGKKMMNPVSPFVTSIESALKDMDITPKKQNKFKSTEQQITLF